MDDSWQFGDVGQGRFTKEFSVRKEREDLEYFIAEGEASQSDVVVDDEIVSNSLVWTLKTVETKEKWVLTPIPKELSLDHGYFVTIKAIQTLREKKDGCILVGIGGPSGSGKSSLAERVAQVFGGTVIDLENYVNLKGKEEDWDIESINFPLLSQHLQMLLNGEAIEMPVLDWTEENQSKTVHIEPSKSHIVILEGVFALRHEVRALHDIAVAVVGGVHYDLLQKVSNTVGKTAPETSLAVVMDSIFPLFRTQIEPDLNSAEIRISNRFAADSLREPLYIMKTNHIPTVQEIKSVLSGENQEVRERRDKSLDMFLKPPGDFVRAKDVIRVRQVGSRYFYTECNQCVLDCNMIIRPRCEFEVSRTTLGGLLACNYQIALSFKRDSTIIEVDGLSACIDRVVLRTEPDVLEDTFLQIRGKNRQQVLSTAQALVSDSDKWVTKSYVELVCDAQGVSLIPSPPLLSMGASDRTGSPPANPNVLSNFYAPIPIRLKPRSPRREEQEREPWTRSPTRAQNEPLSESWHLSGFSSIDVHFQGSHGQEEPAVPGSSGSLPARGQVTVKLLPKQEVYSFDRGLNLALSATQTLLKENSHPVIIGIGGSSGAGKSMLARQLRNLVNCELLLIENYYSEGLVDETNYDEFSTVDSVLLQQNLWDLKENRRARVPVFDFHTKSRTGFRDMELSRETGVVLVEGMFALHPSFQQLMDVRISVVGGVHSYIAARVSRDLERSGRRMTLPDVTNVIFPMFREQIEPHLDSAHLKILNSFDPVHSQENTVFVLRSPKEVRIDDIARALNPEKTIRSFHGFTDSYFYMPGLDRNGPSCDRDFIRIRNSGNRFSILIREPIREGDFIVQSQVNFDVSVKTVGGLAKLGYKTAGIIEVNATRHEDDQLQIEVDHLPKISKSYIQIKGRSKEAVAAAGARLGLQGTYTTLPFIEILQTTNKVALTESVDAGRSVSAAKLQELVLRVNGKDEHKSASGSGHASPQTLSSVIRERMGQLEERITRLERLQLISTINTTVLLASSLFLIILVVCRRR